jgi:hypothetical protein
MSRTNRKYMTDGNYREARKGKATVARENAVQDSLPVGAWEVPQPQRLTPEWAGYRSAKRGGMMMSSRSTGLWRDERDSDHGQHRRREQRSAQAIVTDALLSDPSDATDNVFADLRSMDDQSGLPASLEDLALAEVVNYGDDCAWCGRFYCVCGWYD